MRARAMAATRQPGHAAAVAELRELVGQAAIAAAQQRGRVRIGRAQQRLDRKSLALDPDARGLRHARKGAEAAVGRRDEHARVAGRRHGPRARAQRARKEVVDLCLSTTCRRGNQKSGWSKLHGSFEW